MAGALLVAAACAGCGGEREVAPAAGAAPAAAGATEPRLGPYPRSQFFIERDLFLPADDPVVVSAGEAGFLRPGDDVLGLVVDGKARAYAVTMLSYHHVINDVIAGTPVAVTY